MEAVDIKRFDSPDDTRLFEMGKFETVVIGGITVGRASYDPGWKWSKDVGPQIGKESCDVEHVGMVVSGVIKVQMDDGSEFELVPGDLFCIPPGHDSWVVGDEPYVSIHLQGAREYAV